MCFCPYHKSQKGSADLDVTIEGPYSGKWYCYSCQKSGTIPMHEVEKLRKMRGELKVKQSVTNWHSLNQSYIKKRFESGVFPPLKVSVPVLAQLEWGWDGTAHTFPERDAKDNITGILRRFPDRNKGVVSGSRRGLTIPRINFSQTEPLYITEGMSDLSVILECGMQGIARSNCNANVQDVYDWMESKEIEFAIVIPDNDEPGLKGMRELMNHRGWDAKIPTNKDLYKMYENLGKDKVKSWLKQ